MIFSRLALEYLNGMRPTKKIIITFAPRNPVCAGLWALPPVVTTLARTGFLVQIVTSLLLIEIYKIVNC